MGYWINYKGEVREDGTGMLIEVREGEDIAPTEQEMQAANEWHAKQILNCLPDTLPDAVELLADDAYAAQSSWLVAA